MRILDVSPTVVDKAQSATIAEPSSTITKPAPKDKSDLAIMTEVADASTDTDSNCSWSSLPRSYSRSFLPFPTEGNEEGVDVVARPHPILPLGFEREGRATQTEPLSAKFDVNIRTWRAAPAEYALSGTSTVKTVVGRAMASFPTLPSSVNRSIHLRVEKILESLVWPFVVRRGLREELFSSHDFESMIQSFARAAGVLVGLCDDDNSEMVFTKYWLDCWLCRCLDHRGPRPPRPACVKTKLFKGYCARELVRATCAKHPAGRDASFLYSLQKGAKQSWPAVTALTVKKTLEKHRDRLCTDHGKCPDDLAKTIEFVSHKVFAQNQPFEARKFLPTSRSCRQRRLRDGGALGMTLFPEEWAHQDSFSPSALRALKKIEEADDVDVDMERPHRNGLEQFARNAPKSRFTRRAAGCTLVKDSGLGEVLPFCSPLPGAGMGEIPALLSDVNQWRQENFDQFFRRYEKLRELNQARDVQEKTYRHSSLRSVAIMEPAKVRVVTIGDGYLYSILQPQQEDMISAWKGTKQSTMDVSDLTPKVQHMFEETEKVRRMPAEQTRLFFPVDFDSDEITDEDSQEQMRHWSEDTVVFRSGDYSAATDLQKRHATLCVLRGYRKTGRLSEKMLRLGEESFLPGYFRMGCVPLDAGELSSSPPAPGHVKPNGDIQYVHCDGQPMGHPLSFPTLCVVNRAVLETACLRWREAAFGSAERNYRDMWGEVIVRTALINGDDIAFRAPLSFMRYFDVAAADAGFEISIGKDYSSPNFLMINSQLFSERGGKVTRRGYLNQNLFKGSVKKTSTNAIDPYSLARAVNQTLELYPAAKCALPALMERASVLRFGSRFQPNWFLPVEAAGMGVLPRFGPRRRHKVPGWYYELPSRVTREQRIMAAHFLSDPRLTLFVRQALCSGLVRGDQEKRTRKASLTSLFTTLSPRLRVVRRDEHHTPDEHEHLSTEFRDGWTERFMLWSRMMNSGAPGDDDETDLAVKYVKRQHRLHPCSVERLEEVWGIRYYFTEWAKCPPLPEIRLPS